MGGTKSFIDISAKPPRENLEIRTHAVHVTTDTAPLALIPWPGTMAPNRLIPMQLCAVTHGAPPQSVHSSIQSICGHAHLIPSPAPNLKASLGLRILRKLYQSCPASPTPTPNPALQSCRVGRGASVWREERGTPWTPTLACWTPFQPSFFLPYGQTHT